MTNSCLQPIPVIQVAAQDEPALAALRAEPGRLAALFASGRKSYTPIGLRLADDASRKWSRRVISPYAGVVDHVDRMIGAKGAYLLNYAYEWGCTTGALDDAAQGGPTLMRVLDWPFHGLGRALVVTRSNGPAGPYDSLTWPGFAGVLTASAPGRFAAAINQPPLPNPWGKLVGWPLARVKVARSRASPPTHLLRLAFDQCRTFDAAVELIRATPICIPAIFTLAGAAPGETVTIERTENKSFFAPEPAAANHWASSPGPLGRRRNPSSQPRRAAMLHLLRQQPDWSLGWLRPPILVADTRVAMMANPASGRLIAQGFEKRGCATERLELG